MRHLSERSIIAAIMKGTESLSNRYHHIPLAICNGGPTQLIQCRARIDCSIQSAHHQLRYYLCVEAVIANLKGP